MLPGKNYGEALLPPDYFVNGFSNEFELVAVERENERLDLDQVAIVLKRRDVAEAEVNDQKALEDPQEDVYTAFHGTPEDKWVDIVVHSAETPVIEGVKFPDLPDPELQRNMVGSSGKVTLLEAAGFYREIRQFMVNLGVREGERGRLLDFGCGFGRHLRFFLKDYPTERLFGVDIDPVFIQICERTFPGPNFSVCGVRPPLEFVEGFFDLVYAFSVFSHLNEETGMKWIDEFARLVRPGGAVMVTTHRRSFIQFCASLRDDPSQIENNPWYTVLAEHAFHDMETALQAYDDGRFVFATTGGGEVRTPDFYGEAAISPGYVESNWLDHFDLIDFIDDPARVSQAMIILRRKGTSHSTP
jgi:SAM-dependent methyltransferase